VTDAMGNDPTIREVWHAAWRRPAGRWPLVRWGWALLLPAAVVVWIVSLLLSPDEPDLLTITVESQVAGGAIENASVLVGDSRYLTDDRGQIVIDPVPQGTLLVISADGHETMQREALEEPGDDVTVSLSGVLVSGTLTDRVSHEPVDDAEISILDASGEAVATTGTDQSGMFVFKFVPENAEIVVHHAIYGEQRQPVQERRSMLLELEPPTVRGRVVDGEGGPVPGVAVSSASAFTTTDDDGRFSMDGVGQGSDLVLQHGERLEATILVQGADLGDIPLHDSPPSPVTTPPAGTGQ
jgi:hypothetical protein